MKKIIFIIIFLVLFFSPQKLLGQTTTPTPPNGNTPVTIIGDSLTTDAGAGSRVKTLIPNAQIDAKVSRPWSEGIKVINCVKDSQSDPTFCSSVSLTTLGDVVVFALGTNLGVTQANIDSLLAAVPDKKIVLMTIYRGDITWDDDANTRIHSVASSNPNVKIADWNTLASQHPEWFGSDGTHPSPSGYTALADLLIETIGSSGPNPTNPPNPGTSNCVITKVGNPTGVAPVCPTNSSNQNNNPVIGPCGPLLAWAQTVSDHLELGAPDPSIATNGRYHNRQMSNIYNCNYSALKRDGQANIVNEVVDERINHWYWCTYIVLDSFNLVGLKGIDGEILDLTQADVRDLHIYMDSTAGFQFVDYRTDKKNALAKVRPGYAFFVEACFKSYCAGGAHTGIIKSIDIDTRGNGSIITLESNSTVKSHTWAIAEWEVIGPDYAGRPLVGFGGPI